jgi:DNA repair exonuclease SbcCD ATPase subunit
MPAHHHSVFNKLMIKVQEHETTIASLASECSNLHTAIATAETRIRDLYEEQARMEDELADRNVVTEKLRNQIREVEKEERDLRKRYNDQVSIYFPIFLVRCALIAAQAQTFDAERQAFYDSEQHLKSRIQSLTQARHQERLRRKSLAELSDAGAIHDVDEELADAQEDTTKVVPPSTTSDEDHETPEMIALRLELSTLTISRSSLQNTVQLLQNQLQDLQRVNKEVQVGRSI